MKKKVNLVILILACLLVVKKYIVDIAVVDGNSMYPTLNDKTILLVLKKSCNPEPNDIVLIELNDEIYIVKRIIAVGESEVRIDYEYNTVYVDNEKVDEPYLNYACNDPMQQIGVQSKYIYIVPNNYVFVMGDNRNCSTDSRDECIGVINTSKIVGKIIWSVNLDEQYNDVKMKCD